MALLNDIYDIGSGHQRRIQIIYHIVRIYLHLIFAKKYGSIQSWATVWFGQQHWPEYDESKCVDKTIEIAVQVCGKFVAD